MSLEANKKKLLVVDDDPLQLRLTAQMLSGGENEVLVASGGKEAMRVILSEEPRIVVTDWMMPDMDGLELCRTLRQHEGVRFIYVIVVTAKDDKKAVVEAFEAGADDYLVKPLDAAELVARLRAADRIVSLESNLARQTREVYRINAEMALAQQKLNQANAKLKEMATTDALTGLLNRREAMERITDLWNAQERYGQSFSCIMLDIDHFKTFNDTRGHAAGDFVLKEMGQLLRSNTRKTDKSCRLGGEEFLVLCPNVDIKGAAVCAEHLRAIVEQHRFNYQGEGMNVTISLGVAQRAPGMGSPDDLIKAADEALYASKEAGRNQVTLANDCPSFQAT